MTEFRGKTLGPGHANGVVAALAEPLSFWGGFDVEAGVVCEPRHPDFGRELAGRIVLMETKGSSSSSSVLAEAVRLKTAPAAIVLRETDLIIAVGVDVAAELYGIAVPVVQLDSASWQSLGRRDGAWTVDAGPDGAVVSRARDCS